MYGVANTVPIEIFRYLNPYVMEHIFDNFDDFENSDYSDKFDDFVKRSFIFQTFRSSCSKLITVRAF